MDAAYSSEFASNVMAPTLRRSFLFINAAGKPVFEYRGGIYITPGCDIDGFNAQLACVTRLEKTKYSKSVKCTSDQDCPCLNGAATQYYQLPVSSAGKLTQSVPFERAFHVVGENEAKVYDHLKVELIFSDATKKKNCLPTGYEDGVFYFPIADRTPLNLIGCDVRATGDVVCTSGIASQLGFGNLQIRSVEMSDTYSVGGTAIVKPVITKTGADKMCLWYRVYKGTPETGSVVFENHQVEITELYSDQKLEPGINIFGTTVPQNILGGVAQVQSSTYNIVTQNTPSPEQCKNNQLAVAQQASYLVQQDSQSGSITFWVKDDNGDSVFECNDNSKDKYSLVGPDDTNFLPLNSKDVPNCIIKNNNGVKIKFDRITLPNGCETKDVKALALNFIVNNPNQGTGGDAQMTLVLEGRIPSKSGSCSDGTTKIPTATYTQPFRVVKTNNIITECQDLSGNKGTCQNKGSSACNQGSCQSISQCCVLTAATSCTTSKKTPGTCQTITDPTYIDCDPGCPSGQCCVAKSTTTTSAPVQLGTMSLFQATGNDVSSATSVTAGQGTKTSPYVLDKSHYYVFKYSQPTTFVAGSTFSIKFISKDGITVKSEEITAGKEDVQDFTITNSNINFLLSLDKSELIDGETYEMKITFTSSGTPSSQNPIFIQIPQKCGPAEKGICIQESGCDLSKNNKLDGCISGQICCNPK